MVQENRVIAEFPKNDIEIVGVSLINYKEKTYFDLRLHFKDDNGAWQPTKKGICLSWGLFQDFRDAVKSLDNAIGERS